MKTSGPKGERKPVLSPWLLLPAILNGFFPPGWQTPVIVPVAYVVEDCEMKMLSIEPPQKNSDKTIPRSFTSGSRKRMM